MSAPSSASVSWDAFLDRPALRCDHGEVFSALKGKAILITGAGGSIGSALTSALAGFSPRLLVCLEASEFSLYRLQATLGALTPGTKYLLGSVGDSALLEEIFQAYQPQIVYHAAAFKHVPLLELNPFAAIQNNSLATEVLVKAAARHKAEQLILVSTDKAAAPISMLGASKRIAELTLLAVPSPSLKTKVVRLGNVLGSEGSVVHLFLKQIAEGSPVTVTHPEMRRYFLTLPDAVTLLLQAASPRLEPGILVPDLGQALTVESLARYLISCQGGDPASIMFTQPRPGDKMCEVMLAPTESYRPFDGGLLRAVASSGWTRGALDHHLSELETACRERSLENLMAGIVRLVPEYRPSRPETA